MSSGRTHYEVLGLEPGAGADEVRRRFRELARQYHPDRNQDRPEVHELFVRIKQAYDVLSDPTRRAYYDLELRDRARRAAPPPPREPAPPPPQGGPGRSVRQEMADRGRAEEQERRRREAERRRVELGRMLSDARIAMQRGHLAESRRLCEAALQLGPSGAAHEMLGDIAYRQNRDEEAIRHFTIAAQLQPNNGLIMARLNRAADRLRARGGFAAPDGLPPRASNRMGYRMAVTCFGLAAVLFLLVWRPALPAEPVGLPFLQHTTGLQLALLALTSFLFGGVLAAAGWLRPIDQELLYPGMGTSRRSLPLGLLLAVLGILSLPLAFVVYLIVAWFQQSWSGSVVLSLVAAGSVALGTALLSPAGAQGELLLVGGGVAYLALLGGWFLGDLFRPSWAV